MSATPTADLELTITEIGEAHELRMRLTRPGDGSLQLSNPYPVTIDAVLLRKKESEGMEDYGKALRDMLLSAPAAAEFTRLCATALGSDEQIRVRLVLPDNLHPLRWETLPDPASGRPLALDGDLLLSRYLSANDGQKVVLRPKAKLRTLVAVAAPIDWQDQRLSEINAVAEIAPVWAALADLQPSTITATWDALDTALRKGYDILYLVAHGKLKGDEPWLYLVDKNGNADQHSGKALIDLLRSLKERRPRLVVLASCESAGDGYADALAALGPQLARAGVAAVIAMQGKFSIGTNAAFAPTFFDELLLNGVIDRAVNSARLKVAEHHDWWMPVLYTRLLDAMIWKQASQDASALYASLHQLRAPAADFVGREQEIAEITAALTNGSSAAISGVAGMGGIGKTELAMVVGNNVIEHYPDAQIVLSLQGSREIALSAAQALKNVIRAFMPDVQLPDDEPSLISIYRSVLVGKRALILADDAKDTTQIKPLMPPPGSALLITSRQRFILSGMSRVDLERLGESEAVALLQQICSRLETDEAHQIAATCGHLPLALCVAGGVLTNNEALSVTRYLERLADEKRQLAALRDPDDPDLDVEVSISLSYNLLSPQAQADLRRLSVFAASFDLEAASAILEVHDQDTLEDQLGQLYRRSLIEFAQDRYDLHELVRVFALSRLGAEDHTAHLRYLRYYISVADEAQKQYVGGGDSIAAGLALFDRERTHVDAARHWLHKQVEDQEHDELLVADADANAFIGALRYSNRSERIPQLDRALAAAKRLGKRKAQGQFLRNLGVAYANIGDVRRALTYYQQALEVSRELCDRRSEGQDLGNLGSAYATLGDTHTAIDFCLQQLAIAREIGNRRDEGNALGSLGVAYANLKELNTAISYYQQQLKIAQEISDWRDEGYALGNLGSAYAAMGNMPNTAIKHLNEALDFMRQLGDRRSEGAILGNLGLVYADLLKMPEAIDYYLQHLAIARELGDRRGEAHTSWHLGRAYILEGRQAEALPLLDTRVAFERDIGHPDAELDAAIVAYARQHGTWPMPSDIPGTLESKLANA